MMGLIHVGTEVGFGVYGALCPALSHVTQHHLQQLPEALQQAFPMAHSIALAGRLPGLMTTAGEGQHGVLGMLFTMVASNGRITVWNGP